MPRAVRGSRPRRRVRVVDFEQHGARLAAQTDGALVIRQTVRAIAKRPQDSAESVNGPDIRRRGRYDEKAQRGQDRVGGEDKISVTGEAITADVSRAGLGV